MLLSICLTAYNQLDLVHTNVAQIVKSKSDDIEIVVSDDCSEAPIEEMLSEFDDARIRYCRGNYVFHLYEQFCIETGY